MSKSILADRTEAILDVWYGFVASTPEWVVYFKNNKTGAPDGAYLGAVRKRFGQWIADTADANHDQAWLDYQYEIGLRHTTPKKNRTDKADSVPLVKFTMVKDVAPADIAAYQKFIDFAVEKKILDKKTDVSKYLHKF